MPSSDFFEGLLALKSRLVYAGGVCGRWGIDHNSRTAIWFHLLTKGSGWVHYPGHSKPVAMGEGDIAIFMPHAKPHYFSYSKRELVLDAPDARKTRFEDGPTSFVCAVIELGAPVARLCRVLPPEILVRVGDAGTLLRSLVRHTIDEAHGQRFGSYVLIERLCDSIFVLMVRHCIESGAVGEGVIAALKDRRLETALGLIHREPWYPWTVERLCTAAGLSKTALTDKFIRTIGCPPGEYLLRWRMQTAAQLLRESRLSLGVIAERCGYASVSAFSRAFKLHFGSSPGTFRHAESRGTA